jgi:signal transduction histidine kinase
MWHYRTGSTPRALPKQDVPAAALDYGAFMRTDRGWKRFYLAAWIVNGAVTAVAYRQWKGRVHESEERAMDAERTREETARRRAVEERLRIARELHDSLTHSISVVKMQAGVAIHLARKRGEPVPDALLAIQEASADAARELRSTLGALRRDDAPAPGHGPASGLDRLDELVARARAAGLPATVQVAGTPRPLPVEVDRAAYRIVQESLTNVSRHAGPASAAIRLAYGQRTLTVRVEDDGCADPDTAPVPGHGLIGMRERVVALGGRLRAQPRPDGGFTVDAELPT